MPRSIAMYLSEPWSSKSAAASMISLGWRVPDPRSPFQLESEDGGRAWIEAADDDTKSIGTRLGGFAPSVYVLFEPRRSSPGGVRRMMRTVLAFAEDSPALLLLYQSEDVLLRAEAGRRRVPAAARDWWSREGIADLIN